MGVYLVEYARRARWNFGGLGGSFCVLVLKGYIGAYPELLWEGAAAWASCRQPESWAQPQHSLICEVSVNNQISSYPVLQNILSFTSPGPQRLGFRV